VNATANATPSRPPAPADDVRHSAAMLRFVGLVLGLASLSLGIPFVLWAWDDHRGHALLFLAIGAAGIGVAAVAAPLARWLHRDGQ